MSERAPSADANSSLPKERLSQPPQELPHGLLKPPREVLDLLAREKAKFSPEVYTREFEEQTLNDWTLDYIFGQQLEFYDDVLYRPTPEGPEVLAVGTVEILALTKVMPAEEREKLRTWSDSW
jgi:hypothetical protein